MSLQTLRNSDLKRRRSRTGFREQAGLKEMSAFSVFSFLCKENVFPV